MTGKGDDKVVKFPRAGPRKPRKRPTPAVRMSVTRVTRVTPNQRAPHSQGARAGAGPRPGLRGPRRRSEFGQQLLDFLDRFVDGRVDLSEGQRAVVILWACHTHIYRRFRHTPKLFITGITHTLGKSELAEVVAALSYGGVHIEGRITQGSLLRMQREFAPVTPTLDQLDHVKGRQHDWLIDLLCASTKVGATTMMVHKGKPTPFTIGIPMALARIGDMPTAQLQSRTHHDPDAACRSRPRLRPGAGAANSAVRRAAGHFGAFEPEAIAGLGEVAYDVLEPAGEKIVGTGYHQMPCECDSRTRKFWQPMFCIAMWAGGQSPDRVRRAFLRAAPRRQGPGRRAARTPAQDRQGDPGKETPAGSFHP